MAEQDGASGGATPVPAPGGASGILAGLTAGEVLVAVGGIAIFGVSFLLFQVIVREYTVFQISWMAALGALVAIWLHQRDPAAPWSVPYGTILLVLGWIAVVNQGYSLIVDLRGSYGGAVAFVAALFAYGGSALMLIGAMLYHGRALWANALIPDAARAQLPGTQQGD